MIENKNSNILWILSLFFASLALVLIPYFWLTNQQAWMFSTYKVSGMGSAEYSLGFGLWLIGTAWILTSLIVIFVTRGVKTNNGKNGS